MSGGPGLDPVLDISAATDPDAIRVEVPQGTRLLILQPSESIGSAHADRILESIEEMALRAKEMGMPLVLLIDPDWKVTVA